MYASILNITVDCTDARRQAAFWAAVTGWAALERDATPGHVEYAVMPPVSATPRLYFVTIPEPKQNKNRIHLDIVPPAGGQQAELARLAALGAKVADCQPPGVSWAPAISPIPKATSSAWRSNRLT